MNAMAQDGTNFRHISFKEALEAAKNENKMVFVDCYTEWCGPCKMMATQVFPEEACGKFMNEKFVNVKFDMEKGEGKGLQKSFKCQMYPTFIIFDANGKEVNRLTSASPSADAFIAKMEQALDPDGALPKLKAEYEKNRDMQLGLKLIEMSKSSEKDGAGTIKEVFLNGHEWDRYNGQLLEYMIWENGIRGELFDLAMMYKPFFDKVHGHEVVNRMIFDSFRKDMYLVATGRQHNWTKEDVRKAVQVTGMIGLPLDDAQVLQTYVALYSIEKDYDGMIDFYNRYVKNLGGGDSYRPILESVLSYNLPNMNAEQRAKVKQYYEDCAKGGEYSAKQAKNMAESIK